MSAPLVLGITGGLVFAASLALRGRPWAASLISSAGALLLGVIALRLPLDQPMEVIGLSLKFGGTLQVLGRSFSLAAGNRAAVGFLFLAAGFLFGAGHIGRPGRYYFPAGIAFVGAVAAALMINPFLYAAVFLEISALLGVLLVSPPERPNIRAGLRLLGFYSLAMMVILVTGWMLPSVGVTRATPELAARAIRLLALGFAVLLLVPPFHIWLLDSVGDTNPFGAILVVAVLESAGLFFMLRFLDSYDWLRADAGLKSSLQIVGGALVVAGGLWSIAETSLPRSMVYIILGDLGVSLMAVALGTAAGYQLALGLTAVRILGLGVWGLGMAILHQRGIDAGTRHIESSGYRVPLAVGAALIGLASIAGLPMTAGFPARWGVSSALAAQFPVQSLLVVGSIMAGGLACLRWLRRSLATRPAEAEAGLGRRVNGFLIVGIIMCLGLGLFPQLIFPWVVQVVGGLKNLVG